MPEFTGGLLAPDMAAGPGYTGQGAVPPELLPCVATPGLVLVSPAGSPEPWKGRQARLGVNRRHGAESQAKSTYKQ